MAMNTPPAPIKAPFSQNESHDWPNTDDFYFKRQETLLEWMFWILLSLFAALFLYLLSGPVYGCIKKIRAFQWRR
jgi:hypothetical protein